MRQIYRRSTGMGSPGAQKIMGAITTGMGVLGSLNGGTMGIFVVVGILTIVIGFWSEKNPVIVLHEDHLEMKLAPATARHLIRYRDVAEIDNRGPNKIFLVVHGKKIRLPVKVLEPSDLQLVLAAVRDSQPSQPAADQARGEQE